MPLRRRPDPTLSIYPHQVHIGDRFTDAEAEPHEWEVASRPVTFKNGKEVRVRVQRPGRPETSREQYWPAHARIRVQRSATVPAVPTRPATAPFDGNDVEALRREVKRLSSTGTSSANFSYYTMQRLRGEVLRLEDDKREMVKRLGFMQRQIEELRA